ncbi:MAG: hypothetical protein ACXAEU_13545 [Candidatus Hodarchaeales archaeon]|jgi:hypothetical protein
MAAHAIIEELPGKRTGTWQERLKAKRIYRELRFQRQTLKKQYRSQRKITKIGGIAAVISIILFISSFFFPFLEDSFSFLFDVIPIFFILPFGSFGVLFVSIIVTAAFYGKAQGTKRKAMRFGVLGVLSKKLASECSGVDLFVDFGDATKVTQPYLTARSPYSGSIKRYYYFPWLKYDTNLLDGTKFLLSSHQKVKTKGSGTVRDITTFNFKFSFRVNDNEFLSREQLKELEDMIIQLVMPFFGVVFSKAGYIQGGFVVIDYPSSNVLRFTLKLWGPSEQLIPSGLILMLGEFNSAIRTSYPQLSGHALHRLKASVENPQSVIEQVYRSHSVSAVEGGLKPRQWEVITTPIETLQPSHVEPVTPLEPPEETERKSIKGAIVVDLTFDEEKQFDRMNLYIGDPITSVSEDNEPYLRFEPNFGEIAELAVGIRTESFVWTATCKKPLSEHLELDIVVDPGKDYRLWDTRYAANSAQLVHSPISSFTVGLKLREITDDLMRLSIHSNEGKLPIIFAETRRNKPENIYRTFELVKSIARELLYPRFV